MWTYYCESHPNGAYSLYRSCAGRPDQTFRRLSGWRDDDRLSYVMHTGWVSSSDIIGEAEALVLAEALNRTGGAKLCCVVLQFPQRP